MAGIALEAAGLAWSRRLVAAGRAAVTAAALALAAGPAGLGPRADRRRIAVLRRRRGRRPAVRTRASTPRRRLLLAGGAALAVGLLIGGGHRGCSRQSRSAVGAERLLRKAVPDEQDAARAALLRDLPAACDLLAVVPGGGRAGGRRAGRGRVRRSGARSAPTCGRWRRCTGWAQSRAAPGTACRGELAGLGRAWSGRGSPAPPSCPR